MFTIEEIKAAHAKVKSGADFPNYVKELIQLGVKEYATLVADGNTEFKGNDNYKVSSGAKYAALPVAKTSNAVQFKRDLLMHQQGGTDFPTFCSDCAKSGIHKWVVDFSKRTCTYFDQAGTEILTEQISA